MFPTCELILSIGDILPEHIVFTEPKKNNLIPHGKFTNLLYSNEFVSTNNIVLSIQQPHSSLEQEIRRIETLLLNAYISLYSPFSLPTKRTMVHSIMNQQNRPSFFLKISGIWESNSEVGVHFTIIP